MRTARQAIGKPALVMLCHCVPEAGGGADRRRAWALLRLMSRSHRVFLACMQDGPVTLAQWRALSQYTVGIAIEPAGRLRWLVGQAATVVSVSSGQRVRWSAKLRRPISDWTDAQPVDAVLCTHPSLWHEAQRIPAARRVCDFGTPPSLRHRRRAARSLPIARQWHRIQTSQHGRTERHVADTAQVVLIADDERQRPYLRRPCVIVRLPDSFDPDVTRSPLDTTAAPRATGGSLPPPSIPIAGKSAAAPQHFRKAA